MEWINYHHLLYFWVVARTGSIARARAAGVVSAVTVLGVSGAITLARLAKVQPYLLIVAATLLAMAFYWAYRPQPACADGTCAPTQRQRQRWVVWTAALAFAALAWLSLFPTY